MDGLRDALRRYLPEFAHLGGIWAVIRMGGKWEAVAGGLPGTLQRVSPVLEALADRVLQLGTDALDNPGGAEWEGHVCFPMIVGDAAGGRRPRRASDEGRDDQRRLMGAIATTLAISARNVQLLCARSRNTASTTV